MTKKTENTVVAEAVKEAEIDAVEPQVVPEAPVDPGQDEAPVAPVPEPGNDDLVATEDLTDDERSESGTGALPDILDWTPEQGGDENTWQPNTTNFENSRTLPWVSDPYGLLTNFREAATAAAYEVSGKDEYVQAMVQDLEVLTKHIYALHERTKIERTKLVEQQIERDKLARLEYLQQQRDRLEELKREAARIKEELADE